MNGHRETLFRGDDVELVRTTRPDGVTVYSVHYAYEQQGFWDKPLDRAIEFVDLAIQELAAIRKKLREER